MKTKLNNILMTVLLLVAVTACGTDDADTTKPSINLVSPAEGAHFTIGAVEGMHLRIELADNVALSSCKVEIHSNSDGHHHHTRRLLHEEDETPFEYLRVFPLKGAEQVVDVPQILFPEGTQEGEYHLMVYVTDLAGNEAHVARTIELEE